MHRRHRLLACAVSAGLPFTFFYAPASAQIISWNNPAGGTFSVGTNWLGNSAPGSSQTARFALNSSYAVDFITSPTNLAATSARGMSHSRDSHSIHIR